MGVEQITNAPDVDLVEWSGNLAKGRDQQSDRTGGYMANGELVRRLALRISDLQAVIASSGDRMERLTRWLVGLTVAIVLLTLVLIGITLGQV